MSDGHKWCRDVPRDKAVRAAEDAAAAPSIMHRDLPEAVADLRERVERLEHHFADASKMVTPPREAEPVSRESVNAACNTYCGAAECERAAPGQCMRGQVPIREAGGEVADE